MDEITYKLSSKNVMVITDAISITVKNITKLITDGKNSGNIEQYLKILKDVCASEDAIISSTGFQGLLKLIEGNFFKQSEAMDVTMSIMISVKHYSGICLVISKILIREVLESLNVQDTYKSKWHLNAPVHPFIIMLQNHPNSISDVYNEIATLCSKHSSIYVYCIEVLRPIFIWILCNTESISLYYRCKVLNLIFDLKDVQEQKQLILECIGWQKIVKNRCVVVYELFAITTERLILNNDVEFIMTMLPMFSLILHELILNSDNPVMCINTMKGIIQFIDNSKDIKNKQFYIDITLGLIANTVLSSSVTYMSQLIQLCKILCQMSEASLSVHMIISAFIQWEYNKNILTSDFNSYTRELIMLSKSKEYNVNHSICSSEIFNFFKSTNRRLYMMHTLYANYENIISNKSIYDKWLINLQLCRNSDLICDHILFMQSLLLIDYNQINICINKGDIFKATMKILKLKDDQFIGHLPLTLHCMQLSKNSYETVSYLQGIPDFAIAKENVPTVVDILNKIESSKMLPSSLLINLYIKLFDKQHRCYPYLQSVLVKSDTINNEKQWELLTARSKAIKYISEKSAMRYGTEVIPILSDILSQSTSKETIVAYCLCLKAIELLWINEVIDPISTWQVLAPKLNKEKCDEVIISICSLLSVVPKLYYNSSDFESLMETCIYKLWKYIMDFPNESVNIAAFKALSNYDLKFMNMRQIPDVYKEGIKIPPNFFKIKTSTSMTINDMSYIPCDVWGNLFKYTKPSALQGVIDLCSNLISKEISGYHTGLYNVAMESDNVKYLPPASVVRGLMEYMRKEINSFSCESSDSVFECLKCLSMTYKNPLPPINWCFFSNLLHQQEIELELTKKTIALNLLSKQGISSYSAMKLIIDHLEFSRDIMHQPSEIRIFFTILRNIAKYVKLTLFLPILQESMEISFSFLSSNNTVKNKYENTNLFEFILNTIMECLLDDSISKNVKDSLATVVLKYWDLIAYDSELWVLYAEVCCNLSDEFIDKIVNPINEKSCYIRCKLAIESESEDSLDWLNDIIDAGVHSQCNHLLIISELNKVLTKIKCESSIRNWILKFLSHINRHMQEAKSVAVVNFLCEVLITIVIALSEHYLFCYDASEFNKMDAFPQALNNFLSESSSDIWKNIGCQIIECLHRNRTNQFVSSSYKKVFNIAITASRHSSNFDNATLWANYIDVKNSYL